MNVTDEMVNRFLNWRLPEDFVPDGGVSFQKPNHPMSWPVGTNLLTASQARRMLEHVLKKDEREDERQSMCISKYGDRLKDEEWF